MSALEEMLRAGVPLWPSMVTIAADWETPTEFMALTRLPFGSVNKAVCGAGLRARRVLSQTAAVAGSDARATMNQFVHRLLRAAVSDSDSPSNRLNSSTALDASAA